MSAVDKSKLNQFKSKYFYKRDDMQQMTRWKKQTEIPFVERGETCKKTQSIFT